MSEEVDVQESVDRLAEEKERLQRRRLRGFKEKRLDWNEKEM